jgi:delta 1-pyrroline-5-carboxylate dehydrogenase
MLLIPRPRVQSAGATSRIVTGGQLDEAEKYIAPTVITGVDVNSGVMQEEIFGPILPVIPVDNADEAISFINGRPKPLSLYVFSKEDATKTAFEERTTSGGMCFNETVLHHTVPDLPFGGVGESGMGCYHGKHTFDTFVHHRAVLDKVRAICAGNGRCYLHRVCLVRRQTTVLDPAMRYPPYTEQNCALRQRHRGRSSRAHSPVPPAQTRCCA